MRTQQASTPPQFKAPGFLDVLLESRAPLEFASLGLHARMLRDLPKGDNRPLVLIPGYMADDYSMWPLGKFLQHLGYDVYYADMGRNRGNVDNDIPIFGQRIGNIFVELGEVPVTVLGWSLGGVLAREAARLFPDYVREVITFGTPIVGGPKYTFPGKRYARAKNIDMDEFEKEVHERNSIGFDQPVTSIYSKTDGIVAWQASIDVYNSHARNIEVKGSHLGLGVNPQVWQVIATCLAQSAKN